MTQAIGIVGLGIMGGAFATNLLKAGYQVVGFDVSDDARSRFTAAGGKLLGSATQVVQAAEVTFTSLPTVKAFDAVYAEIAKLKVAGKVLVDACTMPIAVKKAALARLTDSGCTMLDCPVSGTGAQAAKKDLVVFGSGDPDAFETARPALEGMSRKQVFLGEFGKGSAMKFLANHLVNIHNVAAAEAFTLAAKAGIDPATLFDTLQDSAGSSRMFQIRGPLMVAGRYDQPTARIDMFMKDLHIIGEFAAGLNCPLPLFSASTQLYHSAMSQGLAGEDTAAVLRVLEGMAGVRRVSDGD
jgi:putative dehydrogenase